MFNTARANDSSNPRPPGVSRRSLLVAGSTAAMGLTGCSPRDRDDRPAEQTGDADTTRGVLLSLGAALHIHSSFSEGPGSMQAQLSEADRLGLDVVCWTDHDWRMQGVDYWTQVDLNAATELMDGKEWSWQVASGSSPAGSHAFGPGPEEAGESRTSNSLYIQCPPVNEAKGEYRIEARVDRDAYRTSLNGQRFEIDVFPQDINELAALTFDVTTSERPALGDRSAGKYHLAYVVGGPGKPGDRSANGRDGTITLDAPVGEWTRLSFDPAADISAIWPEIDGRDASSFDLSIAAITGGKGTAAGHFQRLTIERSGIDGDEPLTTQHSLMDLYSSDFPDVLQLQGIEISLDNPHLGAWGENLSIPIPASESADLVAQVHDMGGLVAYNHPFGSSKSESSPQELAKLIDATAAILLEQGALGCDALEVGYRTRGGADLEGHQRLWDACSRASVFLTGIGTSDNHTGADWDTAENNFVTWIWSSGRTASSVLDALGSGHAYFGDPVLFSGSLDLSSASGARMGQISVRADHGSTLTVVAKDLPADAQVELLGLPMDVDGEAEGAPQDGDYTRVTIPASDFSEGRADVPIESAVSALYRTIVVDSSGQTIALSNPIWLLTEEPGKAIPDARRVS